MVVKGEKNLKTCGLLDHKPGAVHPHMASGQGQVRVTFDTEAQEIHSKQVASPLKERPQHPAEDFEGEDQTEDAVNVGAELAETDNITVLEHYADQFIKRHSTFRNETGSLNNSSSLEGQNVQHIRHARRRLKISESHVPDPKESHGDKKEQRNRRKKHMGESVKDGSKDKSGKLLGAGVGENKFLNSKEEKRVEDDVHQKVRRAVRFTPTHLLDGGVEHGGNAGNMSERDRTDSSVSSFENSLLTCYDGQILLAQSFLPSPTCTSVHAFEKHGTMETVHEVIADGYYYYIFYSDNDYVQNDIHAVFNIHKPTYQYAKHSRACVNQTECTFPVTFWSDETVIVEVPTRDGIEHEEDDITFLISSCHPRMSVYVIFPVAVLFLILGCAFM
jgi:hypothetical protein